MTFVEDTDYTRDELVADFGEEIALLVDGVTKLGTIKFESKEEIQAGEFPQDVPGDVKRHQSSDNQTCRQTSQYENYRIYEA